MSKPEEPLSVTIRQSRAMKGKGNRFEVSVAEVDSWAARAANLEAEIERLEEKLEKNEKPK